jgi:uncharacterized protein (DUF1697 family)
MRYAVFFRNLNLGRKNCPDRRTFETSFLDAGAISASSFLTNGTIAFDAGGVGAARTIVSGASHLLAERCGLHEPAFLRTMVELARLVDAAPFAAIDHSSVYGCYVTFLHSVTALRNGLPEASRSGDVRVVGQARHEVFCVAYAIGKSPGNPNALVEKALIRPATTRAWNTIIRLVKKHA